MGQALYRKYRSKTFDEVVGQEHITQTLRRAIDSGKISHAYLFTGPKGVGKTSVARILAHAVNDLPYENDSTHLDIIEIDAASNRGIDDARDLREKVYVAPTQGKYKVYIIDEVHMLTREAFNALLKTLEEPPAHVIFILATTEVHKLPETIISRTQRFAFKPVERSAVQNHLAQIAKKEKINITEGALQLLAEHGQGSFRDSISLLDQLSNDKEKITEEVVRALIGLPSQRAIDNLVVNLKSGNSASVVQTLEELRAQGVNAASVAKELGQRLRQELIKNNSNVASAALLRELLDVPASSSPADSLEIALLEASSRNYSASSETVPPKPPLIKKTAVKSGSVTTSKDTAELRTHPGIESMSLEDNSQQLSDVKFDLKLWPQIIQRIKKEDASLYTALRLAKPEVLDGYLILNFQFPLHQKKVAQERKKELIARAVEEVSAAKVKINCVLNKDLFSDKKNPPQKQRQVDEINPLKSISNIFGNAEMIES